MASSAYPLLLRKWVLPSLRLRRLCCLEQPHPNPSGRFRFSKFGLLGFGLRGNDTAQASVARATQSVIPRAYLKLETSDPLTLESLVVLQPEGLQQRQSPQLLRYLPWNIQVSKGAA